MIYSANREPLYSVKTRMTLAPCRFVSVVIPTRNRKSMLKKALTSLAQEQYPREAYEGIVSNAGCTDGTGDDEL